MSDGWLQVLLVAAASAAVAVGQQCGVAGGLTKIVGGESVESAQYPWYVALVSRVGSSPLQVSCGGSLITSRHVLSAAHCFPRDSGVRPEQLYRAVLGLVNRCSQRDIDQVAISRVSIHPNFNPKTLQADVSVITLARAVSYTPVCLPPRNYQPVGPALIIGFGSTLAKSQYPCTLQQARVNIFTPQQCARSSLPPEYSHVPGTICAGVSSGGVDSCDGDSGGPLMTVGQGGAYVIQGIVSFGEGCARKNLPGIYTKVSAYRNFIDSATRSTDGEVEDASSALIPVDITSTSLAQGGPALPSSSPSSPEDPTLSTSSNSSTSSPSSSGGATLSTSSPSSSGDAALSSPPSLWESLLALLGLWVGADSSTGSSSDREGVATVGSTGAVASSRPLSPLEYFLFQLFNRRRVRPAHSFSWSFG